MTINATASEIKNFLRQPYAWPGGYTLTAYCVDGEPLCPACVKANLRAIMEETVKPCDPSWRIMMIDVHWEGPDEYCAHCNAVLPSEYGDPDEAEADDDS